MITLLSILATLATVTYFVTMPILILGTGYLIWKTKV